jgi:adenylylsulfate kinase
MFSLPFQRLKNKLNYALVKTISYRIVSSSVTFLLVFLNTGQIAMGFTLSLLEFFFKPFLYFFHEIVWINLETRIKTKAAKHFPNHLTEEIMPVSKEEKERALKQKGISIWFSGLSGSGKSTLSKLLEKRLFDLSYKTVLLDGDNTRMHLNRDLGFSLEDRSENIRRIAEVSKLLNDSGIITISCFISPTEEIRELAETIIGPENFYLIYTNSSLATCMQRDTKGLYKKAIENKIPHFTGISSPFEEPLDYFMEISTEISIEESFEKLWKGIQTEIKRF